MTLNDRLMTLASSWPECTTLCQCSCLHGNQLQVTKISIPDLKGSWKFEKEILNCIRNKETRNGALTAQIAGWQLYNRTVGKPREVWLESGQRPEISTLICHWMMGLHFEKCIHWWFCHCVNIIKYTYMILWSLPHIRHVVSYWQHEQRDLYMYGLQRTKQHKIESITRKMTQ